jgi:hypothetical protein
MQNSIVSSVLIEPFVDAERAASFLDMPRKTLLGMARRARFRPTAFSAKARKEHGASASPNSINGCRQR